MAKYTSVSISGYNATPPADDGTVSEANKVKWSTEKTKLTDPLKTAIESVNTNLVSAFDVGPTALTTSTTLGASHYGDFIQTSGAILTHTLTDAATLGAGWHCHIVSTDSNNFTLARATGADTINGTAANITIAAGDSGTIFVNAAANGFFTQGFRLSVAQTNIAAQTYTKSIWLAEGADVASASDCNIWTTDGNTVHVTGTTTITDWGTAPQAGAIKMVIFDGAVPLTYDATTNKLNTNGANYTTVAGDRALVYAESTSSYVVTIIPLNGRSVIGALTSSAVTATTSGTSHDITGIPSWVKRIDIILNNVSIDNTTSIIIQIGDSGGVETTGYESTVIELLPATAVDGNRSTTYFYLTYSTIAATATHGIATLLLIDSSTNTWNLNGQFCRNDASNTYVAQGSKSLTGTLDRIRLTTVSGTANFDAGKLAIQYS